MEKDKTAIILAIPSAIICALAGFYLEKTTLVQSVAKYYVYGPEENVALSLIIIILLILIAFRKLFIKPNKAVKKKGIIALAMAFIGFALFGIYALVVFIMVGFIYVRLFEQN